MRSFVCNTIAALACTLASLCGVSAADYPNRPITLIVPYPPGGGVDAMARVVGQKLSEALKQQVVVDNRGGAGGTLGTRAVAKAAPDGYTLLLGHTGTISINPSLYGANAGYDPRKDFAPIGMVASMPVALLAHPSFPAKSIKEFIALAKAEPGKLNVGTSAVGTGGYMCAELFKSVAGVDVAIIPYKGTAPVMNDLIGGHVPIAFGVLPPALGNIAAGNLRAIAVTSAKRTSLLAGCADLRRIRPAGLRSGAALRPAGAGRHAEGNRRQARRRIAQVGGYRRRQAEDSCRGRRPDDLDGGRIRRRYRQGRDQVEQLWCTSWGSRLNSGHSRPDLPVKRIARDHCLWARKCLSIGHQQRISE